MGGGVLSTATKVAGLGVTNAGLRGAHPAPMVENKFFSSPHKISRPIVSSPDDLQVPKQVLQQPSGEFEGWVFAGGDEELKSINGPRSRIIFGGPPTFQEAKSATEDLKSVLDEVYVSAHELIHGQPSNPSMLESMTTNESSVCQPTSHATQAFKLLKENPEAQNVVAAIASDSNVYHAVLQNPVLVEYFRSQNPAPSLPDISAHGSKESSGDEETTFMEDFIMKIKSSVLDMMNRASNIIQSFMGFTSNAMGEVSGFMESAEARFFMGLAVMVIVMVLMQRQ